MRKKLNPTDVWFALPCTAWSSWQRMNQKDDRQQRRLADLRRHSRKLIQNCLILMRDQVQAGGHAHWEWPRHVEPWKWRDVQEAMLEVGMGKVNLDGCM
eukprot:839-Alexandrium_andersonii.AAC.1